MSNDSETIKDVIGYIRGACDMYDGSFSVGDGDAFADRIEMAHEGDLAAKDAEIAKLRALVKELADALEETCVPDSCRNCEIEYKDCTSECPNKRRRALIAKARGMIGSAK